MRASYIGLPRNNPGSHPNCVYLNRTDSSRIPPPPGEPAASNSTGIAPSISAQKHCTESFVAGTSPQSVADSKLCSKIYHSNWGRRGRLTSLDTVLVGTSSSDIDVTAATVAYLALLGRGLVENQPRPVGVVRAGVLVAVLEGSHCRSSVVARKGYRLRRLRHETLIEVSAGLGLELGRGVGEQQHGYGPRFGGRCAVLGPIVNRSMLVLVLLLLVLVPKVLLLLVVLVLKVLLLLLKALLLLKVLLKVLLLRLNILLSAVEVELLLVLLVLEPLLVRGGDEGPGGVLLALEGLLPLHLSFAVGRQGEGKGRWVNDKLWLGGGGGEG